MRTGGYESIVRHCYRYVRNLCHWVHQNGSKSCSQRPARHGALTETVKAAGGSGLCIDASKPLISLSTCQIPATSTL